MNVTKSFLIFVVIAALISAIVLAIPDDNTNKEVSKYHKQAFSQGKQKFSEKKSVFAVRKLIDIDLSMDGLNPDNIHIKRGETVALILNGVNKCKFRISGYGITTTVDKNTRKELTFKANLPGIYKYSCVLANKGAVGPSGLLYVN